MPDFMRPAVYPVVMACIIGSLWVMARSAAQIDRESRADREPLPRALQRSDARHVTTRPVVAGDPRFADLDPD
jgi:hypothetical protein